MASKGRGAHNDLDNRTRHPLPTKAVYRPGGKRVGKVRRRGGR